MKIYFIGQKGIPALYGGIEAHVEDLAAKLAQAGHEVFVYTRPNYTCAELKKYKGINLISLPTVPTKHLDAISHTCRACFDVAKRDADIIHFHSIGPSSLIPLMKLLKPNIPIISTFHSKCYLQSKWGIVAKAYLKFGERISCKRANKTITISQSLTQYVKNKYKVNASYIPNGGHDGEYHEAEEIKKWGLSKGNYILSVSRLIPDKGIHYMIDAYKNIDTSKKLVIAGKASHTKNYERYLKKIAGRDERIIFLGNQTGSILRQLYCNAYLFVQPSESEGLSIALLEAMSYGKAVLVSDISGNMEAIGGNNFVFKNKNVESLELAMFELLNDYEKVKESGIANKQRAKEFYNWNKIVENTILLYKEAIKEKKK